MCCLRYEDQTYEELRKRLPRNKSRVGTPEGDGMVLDSQILTQLVLVRLDASDKDVAVAVEDLTPPKSEMAPVRPEPREFDRGRGGGDRRDRRDDKGGRGAREDRPRRDDAGAGPTRPDQPGDRKRGAAPPQGRPEPEARPGPPSAPRTPETKPPAVDGRIDLDDIETDTGEERPDRRGPQGPASAGESGRKKRRRRRRRGGGPEGGGATGQAPSAG
jgi:hypothetical protein